MRLRTVDGRHYFALKQPGENAQACLEYETEVADRAAMHGAILHMGYYPTVRVAKARRIATLEHWSSRWYLTSISRTMPPYSPG